MNLSKNLPIEGSVVIKLYGHHLEKMHVGYVKYETKESF